jgi:nucleotide-binding universal stress UspA family protein
MYERIVVALDGSDLAEQVLPYVVKLAEVFRSTVTLVRACEPSASHVVGAAASLLHGAGPPMERGPALPVDRDVDAYLAGVAAHLCAAGVATTSVRLNRPAAEAVLAVARRRHATLIAMTTHGRGGLSRLVFGSVAAAVLRAAPCPVLLVPVRLAGRGTSDDAIGAADAEPIGRVGPGRPPNGTRPGSPRRQNRPRGGPTAADLTWVPTSSAQPCPICGATGGCANLDDGGYVCCRNVPSSHRIETCGWLHDLGLTTPRAVAASGLPPGAVHSGSAGGRASGRSAISRPRAPTAAGAGAADDGHRANGVRAHPGRGG